MSEKIRICLVIIGFHNGGIEKVLENYFRYLDRNKFDLHIITHMESDPKREKVFRDMGFIIHKFTYFHGHKITVKNLKEYDEFFKSNHFDIVHNNVAQNLLPLIFAKKYGVPVRILHSHNDYAAAFEEKNFFIRKIYQMMLRINACCATHYFACGVRAGESVFGRKRMEMGKVIVIHNAFVTSDFRYNPGTRMEMRRTLGLKDSLVIGHIGRYEDDQKNQEFVIDIFNSVLKINHNAKMLMIGEGKKRHEIQEKAKKYGIGNQIVFTGAVSNVADYLLAMDVFVFPSKYEGLSVTTLEAQCSGLTGVISDRLSSEMNVLNAFKALPLSESSDTWAQVLSECYAEHESRADRTEDMLKAGYDIRIEAKKLEKMYEEFAKKK